MAPESASPRKLSRKPYGYAANASPWNTNVLIALWICQSGFSILCCIVGGALIPSMVNERNGSDDFYDGDSKGLYLVATFTIVACTVISLGFTILQIIHFKQNRLHPMWLLITSCISAVFWIAVVTTAAIGLDIDTYEDENGFKKYDGILVMYCIAVAPYYVGLIYASIVFHRFKKNQRLSPGSMLHFRYTPTTSPWNSKILIVGWILQAGLSIISVIVGWVVYPSFMAMLITAGTFMSICFTIPQIITWKRNHLHPLGVLLMSVFATTYFLATSILGIIFLAMGEYEYDYEGRENAYRATLILDAVAGLSYFVGLAYASIIFSRFKKNKRLAYAKRSVAASEGDVELGRTHGKDVKVRHSEID